MAAFKHCDNCIFVLCSSPPILLTSFVSLHIVHAHVCPLCSRNIFFFFYAEGRWAASWAEEITDDSLWVFPCYLGKNKSLWRLNQLIGQLLLMYAWIPLSLPPVSFSSTTSSSGPLWSRNYPAQCWERCPRYPPRQPPVTVAARVVCL